MNKVMQLGFGLQPAKMETLDIEEDVRGNEYLNFLKSKHGSRQDFKANTILNTVEKASNVKELPSIKSKRIYERQEQ